MTFLERICSEFAKRKLAYAVVGGHAVALHGALRGTVDIDFVIKWSAKTLRDTEIALNELGLVSRLPIKADEVFRFRDEYIQNRNLIAWNFYNPADLSEQVDIIINYDLSGRRAKLIDLGSFKIRVLDIDELIDMKRTAARPQDMADVDALERLKESK